MGLFFVFRFGLRALSWSQARPSHAKALQRQSVRIQPQRPQHKLGSLCATCGIDSFHANMSHARKCRSIVDSKREPCHALNGVRQELAKEFQASGKLEDAAQAWEAMDGNAFPSPSDTPCECCRAVPGWFHFHRLPWGRRRRTRTGSGLNHFDSQEPSPRISEYG